MPVEAIYGVLAFGAMFVLWVVLPSIIRQRHQMRVTADAREDPDTD
ncbi:MAG: hypothetical protein ACREOH_09720 [Candidatus Entotheonellia bacterium]